MAREGSEQAVSRGVGQEIAQAQSLTVLHHLTSTIYRPPLSPATTNVSGVLTSHRPLALLTPDLMNTCREQDDRIRWATLMALTMLQNHRACLDTLATQFETAGNVGECIRTLEADAVNAGVLRVEGMGGEGSGGWLSNKTNHL